MVPLHQALSRGFCSAAPNVRVSPFYQALSRGFSLIEVVLALGVIAFALVGIMGLFPVAMRSAQESQRETRATLIAQQIFSDLRVASGTNRMYVRGPSPTNSSWIVTNFSLATDSNTAFLAYDQTGSGLTNNLNSANSATNPAAIFLATITVDTNTGTANLSRVQATIEAPAAAPSANRTKYTFVTLMNY
ncbi:MAG: prepilin-type N-terminal cleavage/methylation domain-containing protein [Verrucomicrobia bacterium]|nr:prepilin-type N-terminal cleavage/methylation domain-containing protein [Verrucomicrobiota bacterium]